MRTSIYLSRFLALLFCIVFPLYLAIRGSAWKSDIAFLLFGLPERAALHIKTISPIAVPLSPIVAKAFQAFGEPAKPVRVPERRRRKRYPSLPNGLAHCINSFEQYPFLAEQVLQRKHARYSKQTPAQKAISNQLGYPAHFEKARKGIEVNARFSEKVAQIAREAYHTGPLALEDVEDAGYGGVDLAFGHLSRDWSTQGVRERQAVFPPVLDGLEQHFGGNVRGTKVLVPGSGMGRLASDIADLGAFILLH
jgi:carnosine N-methyltransferase